MAAAPSLETIHNCRVISPMLGTSGQPDEAELAAIAAAGYEVVVNLALHDDPNYSLADEPGEAARLGLGYVHIPVIFTAPKRDELDRFCNVMASLEGRRVWIHCAANKRVSAFIGLYRVLRLGWPRDRAFDLQREIWEPNPVWSAFIEEQLAGAASR